MATAQNLLKSSVARVLFSVISALVAFFMLPFLVSHLGERWYGVWVLVASLVGTSYLLDLGLSMAVIRFVAKHLASRDTRGANEVVNTCLVIYSLLAVVVFFTSVIVAFFAPAFIDDVETAGIVRTTIIILGLQYATEFPFKAFAGIISSYLRYDLLMLSRLLNLVVVNSAFVYLLTHGHGILSLAVCVLVADQLSNYLYFRLARHLFREMRIGRSFVRRDLVRELFTYSTWAFVIQVANQFRFRIDSLVIGWQISAAAVTYYAVGLRLVEYFVDFVNRATNMVTPVFTADFVQNNHDELRRKYLLLVRVNAVMALFGGGMIIIVGRAFILRWMGPTFENSYVVLVILMCAMVFEVIGTHSDNMLYAVSKHKYLAVINITEATVNAVLSLALAKPFGIVGVAIGTAVPMLFFRVFVIPRYVGRFIGLTMWRYYQNLLLVVLFTSAYLVLVALVSHPVLEVPSYPAIMAVGALAASAYVMAIPFVAFDSAERAFLLGLLPNSLRRWLALAWGVRTA